MIYRNRTEAGRRLAARLAVYKNRDDVLVLGLPRGGLPVACEAARALEAPLDVFVVRKLGVPDQPELAMGAIASGGVCLANDEVVRALQVPQEDFDLVADRERAELERREQLYRGGRPAPEVHGRTVILVDDGMATGSTMRAAVAALREQGAARLVVAVPVVAVATAKEFKNLVDDLVYDQAEEPFYSVGSWYHDFSQTTDEEVRKILDKAASPERPAIKEVAGR